MICLRRVILRNAVWALAIVLMGCSPAKADGAGKYQRAIECEMLLGVIGTLDPKLSPSEVRLYAERNAAFGRIAAAAGAELGKKPLQIDEDRLAYLRDMKARLARSDDPSATGLVSESRSCAGLT